MRERASPGGPESEAPALEPVVPRAVAWLVLIASAVAVLVAGAVGTVLIIVRTGGRLPIPSAVWGWFAASCGLTAGSLSLRALRWVFLLRRAGARIPIRDAYIGYFSGLTLLFERLLLGEVIVRAFVQNVRNGVSPAATCVVNLWERSLDVVALAVIVSCSSASGRREGLWVLAPLLLVVGSVIGPVRRAALAMVVSIVNGALRGFEGAIAQVRHQDVGGLADDGTWLMALGTSVAAWTLPALGLWGLVRAWEANVSIRTAEWVYASSALVGGLLLAPGCVLIVGERLIAELTARGVGDLPATLIVMAVRFATAGVAMALGAVFITVHVRSLPRGRRHFDAIASAYDAQIPEARRRALVVRKTELMTRALRERSIGRRGLDVGCGQGWHVARMRELGFDVEGIDDSAAQVDIARRLAGAAFIQQGSALAIPAAPDTFDFAYVINVLHHLESLEQQRAAIAELERVVRPGGLLFIHEINTRNVLFRFHMGYVFPSLHCIDEGHERWLLPHRLNAYTRTPVVHIEYFTFLPEFLPAFLVRALRPLERLLELSPLRIGSAHYMAVLQCRNLP